MYIAAAAALIASALGTGLVLKALRRHAIFDRPNERSSHTGLVPRGGGIAVTAVVVVAWAILTPADARFEVFSVLAAALLLAGVSWVDDLRSLTPWSRLLAQLAAILPALYWINRSDIVLHPALPEPAALVCAGLLWIWFINLFNFMDGIDGITGIETTGIGIGIVAVALYAVLPGPYPAFAATAAAAAIGFLLWNWHPARIFLGDVGSVPLGFLLGWLLLKLAGDGAWAAALILPAYYLADATITLARRGLRGERVWQAHREHFYQRAVQGGRSHASVSAGVGICNVALIGLALLSVGWPWLSLTAAAVAVMAFLYWLSR